MKNEKTNNDVTVHLDQPYVNKTSYRLKFWHKKTRTYLKDFEERFTADTYKDAVKLQIAEQKNEKWKNYNELVLKIVEGDFITYMRQLADKKRDHSRTIYYQHINTFTKEFLKSDVLPFEKVTRELSDTYRQWCLDRYPSQMTSGGKYSFFTQTIKKAEDDANINLPHIPTKPIKLIPLKKKEILEQEELNKILRLPFGVNYREVFLFENFTGISYDDLHVLKWKQIYEEVEVNEDKETKVIKLTYERRKTKEVVTIDLDKRIFALLGKRGDAESRVFPYLNSNCTYNENIDRLVKSAGINKYITSHCGRATCIVRIIESEGIYAAMAQVGHKEITTTKLYARTTNKIRKNNSKVAIQGMKF